MRFCGARAGVLRIAPNPLLLPIKSFTRKRNRLTFFRLPWVQNVLPFLTSIFIHAAIIVIGIVFFYGVQYVTKKIVHKEEVIIPDASMINDGPPGGVPFQGLGADPNRQAFQDKVKDAGTPEGWAEKKSANNEIKEAGGGEGDASDSTIGVGPGGGFGHGKGGHGSGVGNGLGSGADWPLAPLVETQFLDVELDVGTRNTF